VTTRSRWRELFLQPDIDDGPARPSVEQLSGMSRADRRRARVAYQTGSGGAFRTWVYVVALIVLVGGFVIYLLAVG